MPRRAPYTKVEKRNQLRPAHVRGMGDVPFKGFHCLNPECTAWIFVRSDDLVEAFEIRCESCGHVMASGDVVRLYDYDLVDKRDESIVESGAFAILVDDYVAEAQEYKYCIICAAMKPLEMFDAHSARRTGRQGECRLCKRTYNTLKNQTRLTDQHREAAQKRRLYVELSGNARIDSTVILDRFGYACFKCGADLSAVTAGDRPLDHTLPAAYLWPLTTENATLLCRPCNGNKAGRWPAEFYSDQELRRLSALTGIPYDTLAGEPQYNPEALARLQDPVFIDAMIAKYAPYMDELVRLRNRVRRGAGVDFFAAATGLSPTWIRQADAIDPGPD
jgi:5-methylcytosine-specific restriction endonuclease McrA